MTPAQYNDDCVVQRKSSFFKQNSGKTRIISNLFDKRVFIAGDEKWFGRYKTERMGRVHKCYIVKVTDNYACIRLL